MASLIPDQLRDLLDRPITVSFVTIMADGGPQVTPVWCNYDGTHLLINTAAGRQKDKNVRARPDVAVLAVDPDNVYRWLEVRGTVEEITEEGAVDHISTLAKLYLNADDYYAANPAMKGKETREILKIRPDKVTHSR